MPNLKAKNDGYNKKTRKQAASKNNIKQLFQKRTLPSERSLSH